MKNFTPREIYDAVHSIFTRHCPIIPQQMMEEIIIRCPVQDFKRGRTILEVGQVCSHAFLILDGFTKSVFQHLEQDFIAWFMGNLEVIMSVHSFLDQKPSKERIITLKDTTCIQLHYDDWQWLKHKFHEFAIINGELFQHYYKLSLVREQWKAMDATERYLNLMENQPHIIELAGVEETAQFLGISKFTLSNIRSNLKFIGK